MTQTLRADIDRIGFAIDCAIRTLDSGVSGSVLTCGMSDTPASMPDTIAHFDALEKHLREELSRVIATFGEQFAHLAEIRKTLTGTDGYIPDISQKHRERRGYYECKKCDGFFYETDSVFQHQCENGGNSFVGMELDEIHGKDGWEIIATVDPPEDKSPKPSSLGQPQSAPPELPRVFLPRAHGLRPGSKRHRVYKAIEELLQQGSMHVDEILEKIQFLGVFEDVKDQRTNLFNILSQLKTKGLLVSDNRGNWSLPNGAAE